MTSLVSVIGLAALSVMLGAAAVAGLAGLLMWLRRRKSRPTARVLADTVAQLRKEESSGANSPNRTGR